MSGAESPGVCLSPAALRVQRFDDRGIAFAIFEMETPRWADPDPDGVVLTSTERLIMRSMLDGLTNEEIAASRGKSVRTVANQVASVFRKLGVGSRRELFVLAKIASGKKLDSSRTRG